MTEFRIVWLDWDYKEHDTKADRVTDRWNEKIQLRARDRGKCREVTGRYRQ